MENINLEQIDLIMQRANVTYAEAKEALENNNGDAVEALLFLEKQNKIKKSNSSCAADGIKSFFNKLNTTQFTLTKKDKTYLNIPLSYAILAFIFCFPFAVFSLVFALVFGIKVDIKGENSVAEKVSAAFDKIQK